MHVQARRLALGCCLHDRLGADAQIVVDMDVVRRIGQRVAANVSVASVLSSYFADNVTPLMAAVRAPAIILCALLPCIHARPALRQCMILYGIRWQQPRMS